MATSCELRIVVPEPYRKRTTQAGWCLFVAIRNQLALPRGQGIT